MDISNDLISQFAKITNDKNTNHDIVTLYGTVVDDNGVLSVQLDGSDVKTPVDTVSEIKPGERVTVDIQNHTAVVTGNLSSPSTNMIAVDEKLKTISVTADKIDLHGYITANEGFSIDSKGNMTAVNGSFTGTISGSSSISIGTSADGSRNAFTVSKGGVVGIGNISQDGVYPAFRVGNGGNLVIGGKSAYTHTDGITKGVAEITSLGTIYSCSTTEPKTYAQISEGFITVSNTVYASNGAVSSAKIVISDRINIANKLVLYDNRIASPTDTIYFDDIIESTQHIHLRNAKGIKGKDINDDTVSLCHVGADNVSRFGYGSWNSDSTAAYDSGAQYLGGYKTELKSKNRIYLTCNGRSYDSVGGASIIFFLNSSDEYAFRSVTEGDGVGKTHCGTATYPWRSVNAISVNQTSDRSTKENIEYLNDYTISNSRASQNSYLSIADCYNFIKNDCFLATYNHIGDTTNKINFIANDLLVNDDGSDNIVGQLIVNMSNPNDPENSILSFDTTNYISVTVGALQNAIRKIEQLEQEIKALKNGGK